MRRAREQESERERKRGREDILQRADDEQNEEKKTEEDILRTVRPTNRPTVQKKINVCSVYMLYINRHVDTYK